MAQEPEAIKKLRDEKEEARAKALIALQVAINSAPTDPNLLIVLKHIMQIGGVKLNPVVFNRQTGTLDVKSTEYNCGRLSLCLDLLRIMSPDTENLVLKREV